MAEKTRIVLWRHPRMGLMIDLPDGTRKSSVSPKTIKKMVSQWLTEHPVQ